MAQRARSADARLVPTWPGAGWLITLAITSQVLGWLLITTSLPRLPAAMTSVLLTVQPVGSVALAALILGESPTVAQLAGVGAVLAGPTGRHRSDPGHARPAGGYPRKGPATLSDPALE